jgi:hypothetical protein
MTPSDRMDAHATSGAVEPETPPLQGVTVLTTPATDRLCLPLDDLIPPLNDEDAANAFIEETLKRAALDVFYLGHKEIISGVRLQGYANGELIVEYVSSFLDEASEPYRREADPPTLDMPEEARVRLVVRPDFRTAEEMREAYFVLLGWPPAPPLRRPGDIEPETCLITSSDHFGVEEMVPWSKTSKHERWFNPTYVSLAE